MRVFLSMDTIVASEMNQTHGTLFEYTWLWRVEEYGCLVPALVDDTVLVVAVGLQQPLAQVALQHKHTHSHQAVMKVLLVNSCTTV